MGLWMGWGQHVQPPDTLLGQPGKGMAPGEAPSHYSGPPPLDWGGGDGFGSGWAECISQILYNSLSSSAHHCTHTGRGKLTERSVPASYGFNL